MIELRVRNNCTDYQSYRAARVKSLFNVESGANFALDARLGTDEFEWKLGVIVGPSGSGKSSLGRLVFPGVAIHDPMAGWPDDKPIVDAIAPGGAFDDVTGALAAVGLGSVPSWLRPFHALSNGERFRADLARVLCDGAERIVLDEFSSVVDRQIAKVGAGAFAKAWKRTTGRQAVLLSCHYDVLEWLEPDWVFDTASGTFDRSRLRRPKLELQVWQTDGRYWDLFKPHYYLDLGRMVAAQYFVGVIDGEPVSHLSVSPAFNVGGYRASRMVVMPEWQGAGVGMRFLNWVAQHHLSGGGRQSKKLPMFFHTSHPGLAAALRRDPKWRQVSCATHGQNSSRGKSSYNKSQSILARSKKRPAGDAKVRPSSWFGGHFRAVQGFKYVGER